MPWFQTFALTLDAGDVVLLVCVSECSCCLVCCTVQRLRQAVRCRIAAVKTVGADVRKAQDSERAELVGK